jgi:hypothetical protein
MESLIDFKSEKIYLNTLGGYSGKHISAKNFHKTFRTNKSLENGDKVC